MNPEQIIEAVGNITGLPALAITGRRRTDRICKARFLAIAAIRHAYPAFTLQETADIIGRKDHGTVAHAMLTHRELLATDLAYLENAKRVVRTLFVKPQKS